MNTTQHTPGPWAHTPSREHSNPNTTRRDIVAESQFGPVFIAGDVSRSDAAIIAAAPDMLSALEALASRMSENADGRELYGDWIAIAEEAINKAKGGSK